MKKLAIVFPGQGSQAVGMLSDAALESAELFAEASSVLGYDLWDLVANGPEEQLNQTEFTQPALLTASVALYRLAIARGISEPEVVAGHSLGEYSALVAAGVLTFADAVALVQKRGQLMQSAVPVGEGGMAAVLGLADDDVVAACERAAQGDVVQAANFNAPGQVVIAGKQAALERAIVACKEAGAKRAMPLSVSAPFHSELMRPAAVEMQKVLAAVTFNKPLIKIIQNVDAASHDDPETIRANLVSQMFSAVLWTDTVREMALQGVDCMIECGPGKVLAGMAKRIDKSVLAVNIDSASSVDAAQEAISL